MSKKIEEVTEVKVEEQLDETAENAEIVEIKTEQKVPFKEKVKAGAKKVINSKPAKIIGGIGLVAVGVAGALLATGSGKSNGDCIDADFTELDDIDVTSTQDVVSE